MINSKSIENFWTRGDVFSRVHHAMSEAGLINKELNIEDLFPIDQYHARGIAATVELGKRMPISKNQKIIDIGCGLGGPARYYAKEFKCFITGIDITPSFIEIGNEFNKLTSRAFNEFEVVSMINSSTHISIFVKNLAVILKPFFFQILSHLIIWLF